jgi:uncharacterized protein (DUF736 family)
MAKVWKNVGALWTKQDKQGREYYSGNVEINGVKLPITVWANDRKAPDSKQPDYNIQHLQEVEDAPPQ